MPRPIRALVNLDAMSNNLNQIQSHLKQSTLHPLLCVVIKANAYGHLLTHALKGFKSADCFAVIDAQEGQLLRESGATQPILLLAGFYDLEDLKLIDDYQLRTVIHNTWQLNTLKQYQPTPPMDICIKINTGMNRLGFNLDELKDIFQQVKLLQKEKKVGEIQFCTHFASADEPINQIQSITQNLFNTLDTLIPKEERHQYLVSISNSAALLRYPELGSLDYPMMVRAGILSYGLSPFSDTLKDSHPIPLEPVLTFKTKIIAIRHLSKGDRVGYNETFIAPHTMKIAIIAAGYADGYPREVTTDAFVLIHQQKCPIVGKICMDTMMIDISHLPEVNLFDEVILWGQELLSVDQVANFSNSISHKILTQLTKRVPINLEEQESF